MPEPPDAPAVDERELRRDEIAAPHRLGLEAL
jgi:hypothetical protein